MSIHENVYVPGMAKKGAAGWDEKGTCRIDDAVKLFNLEISVKTLDKGFKKSFFSSPIGIFFVLLFIKYTYICIFIVFE